MAAVPGRPDQLVRPCVAPVRDLPLLDLFVSSASQASTVEGSFAASGQERPNPSTAMWLSTPGARQPGMTPRFWVTTVLHLLYPYRKEKAAPDGWHEL